MTNFKRILVPLDGSELAERALIPALALAAVMPAKLFLIRVAIPLSLNIDPQLYQRILEMRQDDADHYLRSIQSRFQSSAKEIETQVVAGRAARSIINFAKEKKIDLIVMSSHGRSGVDRWVYGSVADKVLHNVCCAKLIIRPHVIIEPFSINRILVPLDGSSIAEQALEPALALAEVMPAELILLRMMAAPHLFLQEPVPGWTSLDAVIEETEKETNTYLQDVQAAFANRSISSTLCASRGSAAEGIIDNDASLKADLIVMCSHGRSGIERWVYGSVAERVLRGAICPTLVIQSQETSK